LENIMHFKLLQIAVALATLVASSGAWAEKQWYFLGSLGPSTYGSGVQSDSDAYLSRLGKINIRSTSAGSSTSHKAILGYQLNPSFALEGGYLDTGAVGYKTMFIDGSVGIDSRVTGFNFSALGLAPVNHQLSMFGKLGYTLGSVSANGSSGGTTVSLAQEKSSLGFGFGGVYNITNTVGLRAEWERLYSEVNLLSFGLQARF
jgi:OmpA-OmpF porin, OOP family